MTQQEKIDRVKVLLKEVSEFIDNCDHSICSKKTDECRLDLYYDQCELCGKIVGYYCVVQPDLLCQSNYINGMCRFCGNYVVPK